MADRCDAARAVRLWDPSLANADPITVARALAGVAKLEAPDLIFSGVQSSDQASSVGETMVVSNTASVTEA